MSLTNSYTNVEILAGESLLERMLRVEKNDNNKDLFEHRETFAMAYRK